MLAPDDLSGCGVLTSLVACGTFAATGGRCRTGRFRSADPFLNRNVPTWKESPDGYVHPSPDPSTSHCVAA
jgi:hypothetical protein